MRRFEDAGFTNVDTKAIPDLITGWLSKDGEVESVSINGRTDFDDGDEFPKDADVIVAYHTFPAGEKEPSEEPTDQPSEKQTDPERSEPALPGILTAKNNDDLAAILAQGDNCDSSIAEFAEKYSERTIKFDGSVSAFANHGSYSTRYDILVGPGDKGPDTAKGPTFQFEDVNISDMNLTGKVPDQWGLGDKATFMAKVLDYNENSCLFHLDPIETRVR